jgi:hypothetical protein
LLRLAKFKKKYSIEYNEEISIENFPKVLPLYEVNNFMYREEN